MVKVSYLGLSNPEKSFEELEPLRAKLLELARHYHPASEEFRAFERARQGIDQAVAKVLGHDDFFSRRAWETGKIGAPTPVGS